MDPLAASTRPDRVCGGGGGTCCVARDQLQNELEGIVEAVLERLRGFGHQQDSVVPDLQDPWKAVKELDPDEHEFCRAAALLGVDPFAVHQEVAEAIAAFWQRTEPAIREDMLAGLEETTLLDFSWSPYPKLGFPVFQAARLVTAVAATVGHGGLWRGVSGFPASGPPSLPTCPVLPASGPPWP